MKRYLCGFVCLVLSLSSSSLVYSQRPVGQQLKTHKYCTDTEFAANNTTCIPTSDQINASHQEATGWTYDPATDTGTAAGEVAILDTQTNTAPAAQTTGFAGTIGKATTTLTFSSAADDALCQAGSIVVAGGVTMHVLYDSGALTWTVAKSGTIAAGTAITSIQGPSNVEKTAAGVPTKLSFADTAYAVMSGATCQYYHNGSGNVGIGTTSPLSALYVAGLSQNVGTYGIINFDTNSGSNDVGIKFGAVAGAGVAGYVYIQGKHVGISNDGILSLNPTAGNVGIGTTSPDGQFSQGGSYGSQLCRKSYSATANITAAATATVQVNIPTGVRILSTACQVSSALAAGDLWDLEANDEGTVSALATGLAVALNTADYDLLSGVITDAETDLVVTKNGGGSFTAQGTIRCTVWGEYQTVLTAN